MENWMRLHAKKGGLELIKIPIQELQILEIINGDMMLNILEKKRMEIL